MDRSKFIKSLGIYFMVLGISVGIFSETWSGRRLILFTAVAGIMIIFFFSGSVKPDSGRLSSTDAEYFRKLEDVYGEDCDDIEYFDDRYYCIVRPEGCGDRYIISSVCPEGELRHQNTLKHSVHQYLRDNFFVIENVSMKRQFSGEYLVAVDIDNNDKYWDYINIDVVFYNKNKAEMKQASNIIRGVHPNMKHTLKISCYISGYWDSEPESVRISKISVKGPEEYHSWELD